MIEHVCQMPVLKQIWVKQLELHIICENHPGKHKQTLNPNGTSVKVGTTRFMAQFA